MFAIIPIQPGPEVPYLDKAIHLCEYLLFAWLLVQAVRATRLPAAPAAQAGMPEREYLLWVWLYATSYGMLIELVQALVPWRSADVADAAVNAVGAALGVAIGRRFPRPLRRQSIADSR